MNLEDAGINLQIRSSLRYLHALTKRDGMYGWQKGNVRFLENI